MEANETNLRPVIKFYKPSNIVVLQESAGNGL
jgi:hypothetical protein